MDSAKNLPVAVIGAGPVGLAAAAHLLERGLQFVVLEAGAAAGAAIEQWGHIRLFSPWQYNVDAAAVPPARRRPAGNAPRPDRRCPPAANSSTTTSHPLAALPAIASRSAHRRPRRRGHPARPGPDPQPRTATPPRSCSASNTRRRNPRPPVAAVIDASGTWSTRNPLGTSGLPATGEAASRRGSPRPCPTSLGRDRDRVRRPAHPRRRRRPLRREHPAQPRRPRGQGRPGTRIVWAIRGASAAKVYGGGDADGLAARGQLGTRLRAPRRRRRGRAAHRLRDRRPHRPATTASPRRSRRTGAPWTADVVVPATGFRPDLDILRELRLDLDPPSKHPRGSHR